MPGDDFDDELPDESGPLPADGEEEESDDPPRPAPAAKTTPTPPPPAEEQRLVRKPRKGGRKKAPIGCKPDSRRGPPVQLNEVGLDALNKMRREGAIPQGVSAREADAEARRQLNGGS